MNMQKGNAAGLIWFGLSPDLELYQQLNARLERQGLDHRLIAHHLIAEGTIDERIMSLLACRDVDQQMIRKAVKLDIEEE